MEDNSRRAYIEQHCHVWCVICHGCNPIIRGWFKTKEDAEMELLKMMLE